MQYHTRIKKKQSDKNPLKKDKQSVEDAIDSWKDPRLNRDRRKNADPSKIPATGCRRKKDRRVTRYFKDNKWWLHRDYSNDTDV